MRSAGKEERVNAQLVQKLQENNKEGKPETDVHTDGGSDESVIFAATPGLLKVKLNFDRSVSYQEPREYA